MLHHNGFLPGSTSAAPVNSIDSGIAAGKPDSLTSRTTLTPSIGTLDDVFCMYPEAKSVFLDAVHAANLDNGISGKGTVFHVRKERLLILLHLLKTYKDLNPRRTISLRDAVLDNKDSQKALRLLKTFSNGEKTARRSVFWKDREEALWSDAIDYATSLSDSRFLSYVKTFPTTNLLHDAAAKCEEAAYDCLTAQLKSLVFGISQKILSIQREDRDKQVKYEVKNEEENELKVSRGEFVRKVEDLSRACSKSCVVQSSWVESLLHIAQA